MSFDVHGTMKPSPSQWLLVRIAAVGASLLSSKSIVQMPGDFSEPSISFALLSAALCVGGMYFVWLLQKINPHSHATWERPSWFANPFAPLGRPLELFHLAGWCSIATGMGALFLGLSSTPRDWAWELPFSAGIGVLVGVHLVAAAARSGDSA